MRSKFLCVMSLFLLVLIISCSSVRTITSDEIFRILSTEYKVIIPSGSGAMLSVAVSNILDGINAKQEDTKHHITVSIDRNAPSGKEILVGSTNREDSISFDPSSLGPMDYRIQVLPNGNITLIGGSLTATAAASEIFTELIEDGTIYNLRPSTYTYVFWDHHEHDELSDKNSEVFKSFVISWQDSYSSPQWGGFTRDLKESIFALSRDFDSSSGNGRISVFAHRGDMFNYPENSLAGIISSIMSGADTIELDFRLTKDYVPVLIHDSHLQRVTNWEDVHGKNGLPTSVYVSDWTYDQLRTLNLLDYQGNVTAYKIASIYDAFSLGSGIIQFSLDDKDKIGASFDNEYFSFTKATNSWSSMIWTVKRMNGNLEVLDGKLDSSLYAFAERCLSDGKFVGVYAFYNDEGVFKEWNNVYETMNEDADFWDYAISKGKRYIGTNQVYKLSIYMRDREMNCWKY